MSRLLQFHKDCLVVSDPADPSTWTRIKHKLDKTIWAIFDHKKTELAVITTGVALSITAGILTGGLSLVAQFAIGAAVGIAKGSVDKATEYARYKVNKKQLARLDKADPSKIGRGDLRNMQQNLAYNQEHFQECLFRAVRAYMKLKQWTDGWVASEDFARANVDTPEKAKQLLQDMYTFHIEYDRALHYFSQYEVFVEFSHAFADGMIKKHNEWIATERLLEKAKNTVAQPHSWHVGTCRKSIVKTDLCYGPKNATNDVSNDALPVHHRLTD